MSYQSIFGLRRIFDTMDTGMSSKCFFNNINALNININKIDSVILSHGHFDH